MKELTPVMAARIQAEVDAELERIELPARAQSISLAQDGDLVIDLASSGPEPRHLGAGRGRTPAQAIAEAVSLARRSAAVSDRDQVLELAQLAARLERRAQLRLAWPPAGSGNVADLVVSESGRVVAYITLAASKAGRVPRGEATASQTVVERRFVSAGTLVEGASDEEWVAVLDALPALRSQVEGRG